MTTSEYTMPVRAREIPLPGSVSPEAQAMLAMGVLGSMPPWPALDDAEAWRATVRAMDEGAETMLPQSADAFENATPIVVGGVTAYVAIPSAHPSDSDSVALYIHGGAWVQGAGNICRAGVAARADALGIETWSVDYRMPPDHPFPAAHDDAVVMYRALLEERPASSIIIGGDSAGANIAAGLMFRLRDENLPLPAGLVLDTPATDLTASGDTLATNDGIDTVLAGDFEPAMALYAGGTSRRHPHLSPLFGDHAGGYPHTLLLTGTRDRLLSDTVRMHRALLAARIPVDLHVFEAQGHGGFLGMAPEDADRSATVREFVRARLKASVD